MGVTANGARGSYLLKKKKSVRSFNVNSTFISVFTVFGEQYTALCHLNLQKSSEQNWI